MLNISKGLLQLLFKGNACCLCSSMGAEGNNSSGCGGEVMRLVAGCLQSDFHVKRFALPHHTHSSLSPPSRCCTTEKLYCYHCTAETLCSIVHRVCTVITVLQTQCSTVHTVCTVITVLQTPCSTVHTVCTVITVLQTPCSTVHRVCTVITVLQTPCSTVHRVCTVITVLQTPCSTVHRVCTVYCYHCTADTM